MYIVISRWEAVPGRQEDFDRIGPQVGAILRQQPGVRMVEVFKSGGQHVAVHTYDDEAAYRRIVHDPAGAFAKAVESFGLENVARWISTESGESLPF